MQETAIRCIQKNVRKFMGVRDWPWWRLLVRVTPLLNVHRTEEELRATKVSLSEIGLYFIDALGHLLVVTLEQGCQNDGLGRQMWPLR